MVRLRFLAMQVYSLTGSQWQSLEFPHGDREQLRGLILELHNIFSVQDCVPETSFHSAQRSREEKPVNEMVLWSSFDSTNLPKPVSSSSHPPLNKSPLSTTTRPTLHTSRSSSLSSALNPNPSPSFPAPPSASLRSLACAPNRTAILRK